MTTTELINLLKKYEFGASGRAREISLTISDEEIFISKPLIEFRGSGDGIAGAELLLAIKGRKYEQ